MSTTHSRIGHTFLEAGVPDVEMSQDMRALAAHLTGDDLDLVADAYRFARDAHAHQRRDSGEPYFRHPVAVASILASHHQPAPMIAAALLHDVVEDTESDILGVGARFGAEVARLVQGVTKLEKRFFPDKPAAQLANYRHVIESVQRDPRVLLIKLADRLHNMQTMGAVSVFRRRRSCHETLALYAPLAYRLSAHRFYRELEDVATLWLWPRQMACVRTEAAELRSLRADALSATEAAIRDALPWARVGVRRTHDTSLLVKSSTRGVPARSLVDIDAIEVIVADTIALSTSVALLTESLGEPERVRDHRSTTRANGYAAHHARYLRDGHLVSVHLLTQDAYQRAEFGVGYALEADAAEFLAEPVAASAEGLLIRLSEVVYDDVAPGPGPDRARLAAWQADTLHVRT